MFLCFLCSLSSILCSALCYGRISWAPLLVGFQLDSANKKHHKKSGDGVSLPSSFPASLEVIASLHICPLPGIPSPLALGALAILFSPCPFNPRGDSRSYQFLSLIASTSLNDSFNLDLALPPPYIVSSYELSGVNYFLQGH